MCHISILPPSELELPYLGILAQSQPPSKCSRDPAQCSELQSKEKPLPQTDAGEESWGKAHTGSMGNLTLYAMGSCAQLRRDIPLNCLALVRNAPLASCVRSLSCRLDGRDMFSRGSRTLFSFRLLESLQQEQRLNDCRSPLLWHSTYCSAGLSPSPCLCVSGFGSFRAGLALGPCCYICVPWNQH